MSYTNETTHYAIPKPIGTDLTVPMDYNDAADAVDQALFDASTNASEAVTAAANAVDAAADAVEEVGSLGTEVNNLKGRTSALETSDVIQNNKIDALENQGITKFDSVGIADAYVNGLTYSVGDIVTYNGQRYKCTTAVVAAEPFDADKWTAEDVENVLNDIKSDLTNLDTYVNKHAVGSGVAVTENQYYTPTTDGYIVLTLPYTGTVTNKRAVIKIKNGANVVSIAQELPDTSSSKIISAFIRKGCDVTFATDGGYTGVTGNFYPLN